MKIVQMKYSFLLGFLCLFTGLGTAQKADFQYQIPLSGIQADWHRIELPESVFAHSKSDLSDLRIIGTKADGSTVEAPYILRVSKSTTASEQRPFRTLNQSSNGKGYFYTFALGNTAVTNKIHLSISDKNYDWRIRLEGTNDQNEWFTIVDDYRIFGFQNGQVRYHFSDIFFPESQYKFYRLFVPSKEKPKDLKAELSFLKENAGIFHKIPIQNLQKNVDAKKKMSILDFDIASTFPISKFQIHIADNIDYVRRMNITGLTPQILNKNQKPFYRDILSGTLTSLEKNEFSIRPMPLEHGRIHIWNQDNQPLNIDSISLFGPLHYLEVRFAENADYALCFGNEVLRQPRYDIVNFQEHIPAELASLSLGTLQGATTAEAPTAALFQHKGWLWGIMLLIIGILGWFSVRMLSAND